MEMNTEQTSKTPMKRERLAKLIAHQRFFWQKKADLRN
jgi:hypothetical protein